MPVAYLSLFQNTPYNTSLQPQNPNLSLSGKKNWFFDPGIPILKIDHAGNPLLGLFLSDRYLLNGLIKKKTKIKNTPETIYGVACLISKMVQIRSRRKKKFSKIFWLAEILLKIRGLNRPMLYGCLFCPQYTPFCVKTYRVIHRRNEKFLIYKTGYLELEKTSLISK